MSGVLLAGFLVAAVAAVGAAPGERVGSCLPDPRHLDVAYERPWGALPVQRGSLALALPVVGRAWLGAEARSLVTPSVRETSVGCWLAIRDRFRVDGARRQLAVDGLAAAVVHDFGARLGLEQGPWRFGWSVRAEGLGDPVAPPVLRRRWVLQVRSGGVGVGVGRRNSPWGTGSSWDLALHTALRDRLALGLRWRGGEVSLALHLRRAHFEIRSSSTWTGPRAGGFGLRLRSPR